MTPREAVEAALADNSSWMESHVGIVEFILSECELGHPANAEYDEFILSHSEEVRRAAEEADARMDEAMAQVQEQTLYPIPEENFWDDRTWQ